MITRTHGRNAASQRIEIRPTPANRNGKRLIQPGYKKATARSSRFDRSLRIGGVEERVSQKTSLPPTRSILFYKYLLDFVKTLQNWFDQILAYFDRRISNGFVEGMNRAIRFIISRAFGFRNFDKFRLQVLAQHGPDS